MSEDNFIARWSRRKREAENERRRAAGQQSAEGGDELPAAEAPRTAAGPGEVQPAAEPPFDPDTLPPIESIVAGTDIRAFLQKGVPAELTKAALRRAWTTDPAIRDFIGLAENQWDFTDPTSIPGFGPLEASGQVQQLVSQAMGRLSEGPETVGLVEASPPLPAERAEEIRRSASGTEAASASSERESADGPDGTGLAASQHPDPEPDKGGAPRRRGHGTALPQ